jgi:branched-chain amino acid transport system permease protein
MLGFSALSAFLQVLINGILLGTMYGVAAIGLSLIFGSMQIVFLAQGAVMILGAYCVYWMVAFTSMDPLFGFLLIIPVFMGLGWLIYVGLFQRVAKSGKNPSLVLAFGLMVLLEHFMSLIWSPNTRSVTTSYATSALYLGDIHISVSRLMVAVVALMAAGLVFVFLRSTLLGKAVRAVTVDMHAAALLGISPSRVSAVTFAGGMGLAGVAGVATCIIYPFDPYFGFLFSIKALIAVAFGGLGSVQGPLLGGVLLGVLENLSGYAISAGWADAVSYGTFLLILIFRPQGLLGERAINRA